MRELAWLFAAVGLALSSTAGETLAPAAFEPLPAGSICPAGWLGRNLEMQADGLIGHLYETSPYLVVSNRWLEHESPTASCWEEGPCWARTFVKLAVLTQNDRMLKVAEQWMRAQVEQALPDGWYGYRGNHKLKDPGPEIFPHIIMNEAILTWYEYTRDPRYLELLRNFFVFLDNLPEKLLLPYNNAAAPQAGADPQEWERKLAETVTGSTPEQYYWHRIRGGDMFKVLFKVYELTKEEKCLRLADRVFRKTMAGGRLWEHETGYSTMWCNIHTVNFAERFPYGTVYWRRSGIPGHRAMGDYWYDLHMQMWGQMPRGAYAAGEQIRAEKTDPNQSFESCAISELTRSFCLMGGVTGDCKWGDRAEDMVFNYAPCAYTPDWKKVHYLNAPNMVNLDVSTVHDYYNGGGHIAYSAHAYRCCLHNGGLALPMFAENLVQRGKDGEMVVFLYAPHSGRAEFGDARVSWSLDTRYPFREEALLTLSADRPLAIRFRRPGWCTAFLVNGEERGSVDGWVVCEAREGENRFALSMKAVCRYGSYPRNGGVSVDRGPLTYSLALGETVRETPKSDHWTSGLPTPDVKSEYLVSTPWNYGLDISRPLEYHRLDYRDECFAASNACCEIIAHGKAVPEWKLNCNQPGDIPFMPVDGQGDEVALRFVPMGCQRCRLTVLPILSQSVAGSGHGTAAGADATVDAGPGEVRALRPAYGVGTLEKVGAGVAEFPCFPCVRKVVVREGTVRIGDRSAPAYRAGLFRRWTFDGTLADEVTGQSAALRGTAALDAGSRTVTVRNGDSAAEARCCSNYIDLNGGVLPASGAATVEIWFSHNAYRRHSKLFAVGSGTANELLISVDGANENAGMSANVGEATTWKPGVAEIGRRYHVSLVISNPNSEGNTTLTYELSDADAGTLVDRKTCVRRNWSLSDLEQAKAGLGWGTTWWNNYDAAVTIEELRVWSVALSDGQIAQSVAAGPDEPVDLEIREEPTIAGLRHRWSFDGDLTDSVTGDAASLRGNAILLATGKGVDIRGGGTQKSSYVDLGTDTLPTNGAATVEIWFNRYGYRRQAKLFSVGAEDSPEGLLFSLNGNSESEGVSANFNAERVASLGIAEPNRDYHVSMTCSAPDENGRTSFSYALHDAETAQVVGSGAFTTAGEWSMADVAGMRGALGWGTAYWGNYDADAVVSEFRVWHSSLPSDLLAASVRAGPDGLPKTGLTMAAGAVVDAAGRTVCVGDFSGEGTFDGNLEVKGSARIDAEGTLTVNGDLRLDGSLAVSSALPIVCTGTVTLGRNLSIDVDSFYDTIVIRAGNGFVVEGDGIRVDGRTVRMLSDEIRLEPGQEGFLMIIK